MPLRPVNRNAAWLLPPSLDELIPQDHPARFVGAFVDSLNRAAWAELGIGLNGEPLGAPAYHPRALLSVWLYGFMTGTRSSRKLEAACRDQFPYLWLTGWQNPDHNTLWRFYREHRGTMRQLFKRTVHTAVKVGLVDMAVQAVDGTKVAGNASKERTYDKEGLKRLLERTEKTIRELEKENEEGNDPAPVHLPEKLAKAEQLRVEVKAAMMELEEEGRKRINLTDKNSELVKGRQGIMAGYNAQAVVSPAKIDKNENGLIITAADLTPDAADVKHLVPMMEQAKENTGEQAIVSLADGGYHSGENLEACNQRENMVIMPDPQERALEHPYHKDKFIYDESKNIYTCPQGQILYFRRMKRSRGNLSREYRALPANCRNCSAFKTCTKNGKYGRRIEIGAHDSLLRKHRELMATEEAKTIYKRRKELVEPTFGILKEQMGMRRFLLRGLSNVKAEFITLATAFNLRTLWRLWRKKKAKELGLQDGREGEELGQQAVMFSGCAVR
jgi:transposase